MTPEQELEFAQRLEAMFHAHPKARAAFSENPNLIVEAREFFLRRQAGRRARPVESDHLARHWRRRPLAKRAAFWCLASFAAFAVFFTVMSLYAFPLGSSEARTPVLLAGSAAIIAGVSGLWNGIRWAQFSATF